MDFTLLSLSCLRDARTSLTGEPTGNEPLRTAMLLVPSTGDIGGDSDWGLLGGDRRVDVGEVDVKHFDTYISSTCWRL